MEHSNIVIGFGHRRRRGKDLCCELGLAYFESMGISARIDHFAHSLKEGIGRGVFGLSDEQLYGDKKEVEDTFWGLTPGKLLQIAGTECMRRGMGESIWVRTLRRRLLERPERVVLIGDVRFPNEADAIKSWGGVLIRVDRPGIPPTSRDNHISETALEHYDGWDHVLRNDNDKQALRMKLEDLLDGLGRDRARQL